MRLKIDQFLKTFGLRQISELQAPRLHAIKKFDFPMETVYHFQEDNTAVLGPSQVDPIIAKLKGKVFIDQITELKSFVGNPKRTSVIPASLVNDFRRQNRFFKPLRQDASVKLNQQNVALFNYNLLNPLYRYIASYKANYYRWINNAETRWIGVQDACERFPTWNHFIELHVPDTMPTMAQFKMLETSQTQNLLEIFRNGDLLNLFDMYRFLGKERKTSFLSKVDKKYYSQINFFVRVQGSFFVINLGRLDEWREQTEEEKEEDVLLQQALSQEIYETYEHDGEFNTYAVQRTIADLPVNERRQYGFETYVNELGLEAYFKPELLQRRFISLMTTLVEYAAGNDTLIENDANVQANTLIEEAEEVEEFVVEEDDESEDDEPTEVVANKVEVTDITDTDILDDVKPLNKVYKSFDLDILQVTFEPPPELELDRTTLLIENDELSQAAAKTLKVEEARPASISDGEFTLGDELLDGVARRAFRLAKVGMISERTFEQAIDDAQRYETLPDPFGSGLTIKEAMQYSPEDFELPKPEFPDRLTIPDKTMLKAIHKPMKRKYIKEVLPKDILNCIMSIQRLGVAVTDIKIQENEDVMNHTQTFTVTVKPVRGISSQLTFTIPVIDRDNRFRSGGVQYVQKTQRIDIPIRKVSPIRVALTSYTNKTFVGRSVRAEHSFDNWLTRQIEVKAKDSSNDIVTNPKYAELNLSAYHLPRIYTALAGKYVSFDNGKNHLYFNYPNRAKYFKEKFHMDPEYYEKDGLVLVGVREGQPILVDHQGVFYLHEGNDDLEPMGLITDLVGINAAKAPLEAIDVKISGKDLPIGFVLGYRNGLTNLLKSLNVNYQAHPRGTRITVTDEDYVLAFNDEILVFPRNDYKTMLVLGGLKRYHKTLRQYSRYDFDKKDVYHRVLLEQDLGTRFIREIDFLYDAFVDPITKGLLEDMKEPTTFEGLLYRSIELLMSDWAPSEVDGAYMRYRGYERIAGQIYSSLSKAVKRYNSREGSTDVKVVLDRHEVWTNLMDPTVATIEDSNPMANIREQEAMTYRGDGGRAPVSMVARTRVYGEADLGVVSESTVDSGDVGIIAYLTPDANFTNIRGITRLYDPAIDSKSKLMSSSALLGVATAHDDPKRINFVAIQQQQGIYADGNDNAPLRTGYEQIVGQRNSSIFASAAEDDGTVVALDEHGITVQYASGEVDAFQLGTIHGTAAGVTYPHDLVTKLKKGDKFKRGDTITYNRKYFKEDRYNPTQVSMMPGVIGVVAFCDNLDTLEDGSVVSESMARKLNTQTTDVKNITVRFDQHVTDLVKVGDHLDLSSILCIIEDPETAEGSLFDDASLETLKRLSAATPTAKVVGTVSKIECFYHGDIEDMSEGIRELAERSDRERAEIAKSTGRNAYSGEVDASFRVKGQVLDPDSMIIRIYIDHDIPYSVGDKAVLCNQMKTVTSRVMTGRNELEDGTPIDIIFGNTSVEERMVMSPKLIATTSILLKALSKRVAGVYRGTVNAKAK